MQLGSFFHKKQQQKTKSHLSLSGVVFVYSSWVRLRDAFPGKLVMWHCSGSLLMWGRKIEPGIKRSGMRQILHVFRVNRNLQDTCPVYVASGMSETNT